MFLQHNHNETGTLIIYVILKYKIQHKLVYLKSKQSLFDELQ